MNEQTIDTVRLQRIMKGFWESAALMSAVELQIFTAISEGKNDIEKIAVWANIEVVNAERLLTALTAMELLERTKDTFENAPDVERFLVNGKPGYAGPWMLFTKPRWDDWGRLTEHLKVTKEKQRKLGMYDAVFTVDYARRYHEATYSIGMGAARRFHKQVNLKNRLKIMDLGGGSGCYCIVAAKIYNSISAVVLDLPPVIEVTRDFLVENKVEDRVQALSADFTVDSLPSDCDVAIMASNLPQYSREIIQSVVQKVYDALLPGGEYHLIGEMIDDDRRGPHGPAMWGLSEAISNSTGLAHTIGESVGYLKNCGFENIVAHDFIPKTLTRVTGYKP